MNKNLMFDVITFGSSAQDIYVKSKEFLPVLGKTFTTGKGICVPLGAKIEVENIFIASGGGGTNAAATFSNQGLKTAYCGMVGRDCFGDLMIEELKMSKIDTAFVSRTGKKSTNISVFLAYPGKDRTILVYRGASDLLAKTDIPWPRIKNSKWFYLAPFSGKLTGLTQTLVDFAIKNKIKVALNPGYGQLTLPRKTLADILSKINVLILNKEEASLLTKIPFQKEAEVFRQIDKMTKGITIMTKGGQGAVVSDGKYLYRAKSLSDTLKLKIVDTTGAGDAFGSGFVAGLIRENDIVGALQFAMANSGYSLTAWGAKEGLLKKNQKFQKVKVEMEECGKNNLCNLKII